MGDEKLPEYVEEALNVFQDASVEKGGFMGPVGFDDAVRKMFLSKVDLRAAIRRFVSESELRKRLSELIADLRTGSKYHYETADKLSAVLNETNKV